MTELTKVQQAELQKELDGSKDKSLEAQEKKVQSYFKNTLHRTISKDAAARLTKSLVGQASRFRSEFRDRTSAAIIAAFGFLIALSWQDLIKNLVTTYTKTDLLANYPYIAQLISAILITIIAVVAIMIVNRWAQKPQ